MMTRSTPPPEIEIDVAEALGANRAESDQILTVYIPDKDCTGDEVGTQRKWVLQTAELLARIGGGVTIMPPVEGGWLDEAHQRIVWERPVLVYTYIKSDRFAEHLPELRRLIHRMGRDTNQGEMAVEFDGIFYRITEFDSEER